jgi:hypothetical protein
MLTYADVCSRMLTYADVCSELAAPSEKPLPLSDRDSDYYPGGGTQFTSFTGPKVQYKKYSTKVRILTQMRRISIAMWGSMQAPRVALGFRV